MSSGIVATERYGSNAEEYQYSSSSDGGLRADDSKNCKQLKFGCVKQFFKSAFLPQGYPDSVSDDYLEYQCWDTMQAFCSSITGTLATQAVLKGYGVGDQTATVAGATITWMLKDGMGMVGRIMFAWLKGTQLDCDAKRWRLFADVLNDLAILLDLIAPVFKQFFVLFVCASSIARSIVGVAGGATRAALTLHQARRDNMADVSAKDGSQETLVNLMALLAGFVITPMVTDNQLLVWLLFFIFTFLHLFANYRAVCCVVMETLNLPRLYLAIFHYLNHNEVLAPKELSKIDPVLSRPGYSFTIKPGSRLGSIIKSSEDLKIILDPEPPMYVVGLDEKRATISIVLHKDAVDGDIMRGCFNALFLDILVNKSKLQSSSSDIQKCKENVAAIQGKTDLFLWQLVDTDNIMDKIYPGFVKNLTSKGWNLKTCHLGVDEWRSYWNKKKE